MSKNLQYFLLFCLLLVALASCKKDDDEIAKNNEPLIAQGNIAGVTGPTSGIVNEPLTFDLTWQSSNIYTQFDHLQDTAINNNQLIKLYTVTNISDTTAVASVEPVNISYTFTASEPGTYYLKFYKPDNSDKNAIIDTVQILAAVDTTTTTTVIKK